MRREIVTSGGREFRLPMSVVDDITWRGVYAKGYREAKYPVPAIAQEFEFGWSLSESRPVLMHWIKGVYDESV